MNAKKRSPDVNQTFNKINHVLSAVLEISIDTMLTNLRTTGTRYVNNYNCCST